MLNAERWVSLVKELCQHHLFGSADTLIVKAIEDRLPVYRELQDIESAKKHPGHQLQPGVYFLVT